MPVIHIRMSGFQYVSLWMNIKLQGDFLPHRAYYIRWEKERETEPKEIGKTIRASNIGSTYSILPSWYLSCFVGVGKNVYWNLKENSFYRCAKPIMKHKNHNRKMGFNHSVPEVPLNPFTAFPLSRRMAYLMQYVKLYHLSNGRYFRSHCLGEQTNNFLIKTDSRVPVPE